ncbi:MAG: ABC transporter ATP-binding protein [Bifidobacterium mongoliense]|jgi:ABC-2 type transport system ATP-binding protein|uniref:ABC transporter ATP-binding protein n=1 Tax=Bifidobacterium mongoliense TaxID=518643 RepID=UPI002F3548C0
MYVEMNKVSKTMKRKPVLRDVTVGFDRARIYGIVGPNGSGKTMLLRSICGFIRPDAGTITIDGMPVVFNQKLPDSVGVIIENPGFVLSQTGMQNLEYLAGINHAFDGDEVDRLLGIFGLDRQKDEKVATYSLGMRQKLGVVQALMERQNLILLDEPTNGLDERSVQIFINEMKHQRDQGRTIIIASHHKDELQQMADRLYTIADGQLGQ